MQPEEAVRAPSFTPINERFSYDRLQRLGSGTYGTVYLGREREGGAVAVKVIERGTASRMKWEAGELVEVALLRRLSGQHPNMLQFLDCEGSRFTPEVFIFMELCEKGALSKLITRLTELDTFLLFRQLVDGMDFLHQQSTSLPTQASCTTTSSPTTSSSLPRTSSKSQTSALPVAWRAASRASPSTRRSTPPPRCFSIKNMTRSATYSVRATSFTRCWPENASTSR